MSAKGKYLGLDTEHTGFFKDKQLLKAAFIVYDSGFNILERLLLNVKTPYRDQDNEPVYTISPRSMAVNGIDLIEHDKVAEYADKLENVLKAFLKKYSEVFDGFDSDNKPIKHVERLTVIGQNATGDIELIKQTFPGAAWSHYVSYVPIDTLALAKVVKMLGFYPKERDISLQSLAEYYGVGTDIVFHDPMCDAEAAVDVFCSMVLSGVDQSVSHLTRPNGC